MIFPIWEIVKHGHPADNKKSVFIIANEQTAADAGDGHFLFFAPTKVAHFFNREGQADASFAHAGEFAD